MSGAPWPHAAADRVIAIFSQHADYQAAHAQVCREVKQCTPAGMKELLRRAGKKPPREYLRTTTANHPEILESSPAPAYAASVAELDFDEHAETRKTDPVPPPPQASRVPRRDDEIARLVDATKRGALPMDDLCDALDMSPRRVRSLVERARAQGINVAVAHDHIGIPPTIEDRIQNTGVPPTSGQRQIVGVISDTHLGSKYCLREQLRDFVHYAYSRGVREILHPGDVIDGIYKHGIWEVSHSGLDAQVEDLIQTLPCLPGLTYRAITGNHDETTEEGAGLDFGSYVEGRFAAAGRSDIRFYGRRSAFLRVHGAVFHLWHPRGSLSYAKSYKLQKIIEAYSSGEKPHVLLVGHFHQFCFVTDRGVHGILCPTFQGGGSAFGKSLGGAPTMGGLLLSWESTEGGTLRRFAVERSQYFEVERPHLIDDETGYRGEIAS
jgi:predicted phosphodiesterase